MPPVAPPDPVELREPERIAIDYGDQKELVDRLKKAQKALATDAPATWKAFQAQGIFRGSGPAPGKVAFLFTGQGSQYVNMGRDLAAAEPVVADVFKEADAVLERILGRAVDELPLRRRQGPRGAEAGGRGPQADRHHPARGPEHGHRHVAVARRVRDRAGHGDGALARRVRGPGVRRRPDVRRGPRGRGGPRAGDEPGQPGRQRRHGRGHGPDRAGQGDPRGDRGLRGAGQPERPGTERHRGRDRRGGARGRGVPEAGLPGPAPAGQPRLPHQDRGSRRASRSARSWAAST